MHEQLLPNPASPYAASKLAAENYVRTIGALAHIETGVLRIFNAYGPGQLIPPAYPPVIPQFMRQLLDNGSLVIHGTGEQTRDYIYVDDVVAALVLAGATTGLDREIINIGTGLGTSLNTLIAIMEKVTGRTAHTLLTPATDGGLNSLVADTTKARKLLGFQAKTSLEKGLAQLRAQDAQFAGL